MSKKNQRRRKLKSSSINLGERILDKAYGGWVTCSKKECHALRSGKCDIKMSVFQRAPNLMITDIKKKSNGLNKPVEVTAKVICPFEAREDIPVHLQRASVEYKGETKKGWLIEADTGEERWFIPAGDFKHDVTILEREELMKAKVEILFGPKKKT